uniref:Uncharacterized protein n=1 Tax=Romanomermis culicivorax TaxID=13658 RepID=A0A915IH92_ROMCU
MIDKAEVASNQQKPQQILREYKILQRTPPQEWYPSVPTTPITAQIQPRTTDEYVPQRSSTKETNPQKKIAQNTS